MFTEKDIRLIPCGAYQENCYLLAPEDAETCCVIDPGDGLPAIRKALQACGRRLEAILLTHGHFDHTLAAAPLQEETGAVIYLHARDGIMLRDADKACYDEMVCTLPFPASPAHTDPGDALTVCGQTFRILHTPGHSLGSVCYLSEESGIVFTGDTLFCAGYGRTDLYGGDTNAIVQSLRFLLNTLPPETKVYPGHGSATTIEREARRYRL